MVVPQLVAQKLDMGHPYGFVGVTKYTVSGRGDFGLGSQQCLQSCVLEEQKVPFYVGDN